MNGYSSSGRAGQKSKDGEQLGTVILKVFSKLNNSIISQ